VLRSLRARIVGTIALITLAGVVIALVLAAPLFEGEETRRLERELTAVAREAAARLQSGAEPEALAREVAALAGARVTVFDADGRVIVDSSDDAPASPSPPRAPGGGNAGAPTANRPPTEVEQARADGSGMAIRPSLQGGAARLYVGLRADRGTVVRVDRSLATVDALLRSVRSVTLVVGLVALALGALLAELLARSLVRSLGDVQGAVERLGRGDLTARVRSAREDELGALAREVDRAADAIGERLGKMIEEEDRLRTILDAMVEGVLVTDREGRIVLTNAALVRMTGRVEGRTVVEAIRSPELRTAVERALRGDESSVQIETRIGGDLRQLAAHVAPLAGRNGVVAVLHDVTSLKLADTVRRDFVANASHELRTPLTAIRGFAETLRDGAVENPELARRFVTRIFEHAVRLGRLVDDLLELSRAESPEATFALESVELGPAVAKVLRGLESAAAEKRIALGMEGLAGPPLRVRADVRGLDHVLVNLVDNAVKYTPEGGQVTVRAREDGAHVEIEVTDTGGGIAPQHLPRLFERFYRVDAGRSREVGGTGLGLAIVKHFVQRMGGEVTVDSKLGRGTTFRVRLERGAADEAAA
jgi:two-component system phosphate regulon sensor histidine kinase PhoR